MRGYARWIASIASGFLPWMIGRGFAHAIALTRWRTAGECRNCRSNLTWRIGGSRPTHCHNCGFADPCPENTEPSMA